MRDSMFASPASDNQYAHESDRSVAKFLLSGWLAPHRPALLSIEQFAERVQMLQGFERRHPVRVQRPEAFL